MGLPSRRSALVATHFPPDGTPVDALNLFATPAQRRLIFEEAFLFQMGVLARRRSAAADRKPSPVRVDDRIRESARRVLPFRLTAGQKQGAQGDRRRSAAAAADEPAAAGRRRRGQDDRGAAGRAGRDGERAAGGVHGADRDPGRAALPQHLAVAARLALPRGAPDGRDDGRGAGSRWLGEIRRRQRQPGGRHARAGPGRRGLHAARARRHRRAASLRRAAARDAAGEGAASRRARDDRDADSAHAGADASTAISTCRSSAILPPGRRPIKTTRRSPSRAATRCTTFVRQQLEAGRQAYVIYPLVEESDKIDLKAATEMADHLAQEVFPELPRRPAARPDEAGREGSRDEGVRGRRDARSWCRRRWSRSASTCRTPRVMVVEHAERFGLSQLHQLRGRVGRDRHQSYCFLLYQSPLSDEARGRLKAMIETTDGFEIAERDLRLRGPGDFFGTRQAGVPTFRVIDLVRDRELLELAQREAGRWFESAALSRGYDRSAASEAGRHGSSSSRWDRAACASSRERAKAVGSGARPGRACGRRPTGCARRCSTSWRRASRARACSTGTPAPARSASRRSAAAPRTSRSSSAIGRAERLIADNLAHCGIADRYAIIRGERRSRDRHACVPRPRCSTWCCSIRRTGTDARRGARCGERDRGPGTGCWSSSTRGDDRRLRAPDPSSERATSSRAIRRCRLLNLAVKRHQAFIRMSTIAVYPGSFDPADQRARRHHPARRAPVRSHHRRDSGQRGEVAAVHGGRTGRDRHGPSSAISPTSRWTPSTDCSSTTPSDGRHRRSCAGCARSPTSSSSSRWR